MVGLTLVTALDWRFGTGFDPIRVIREMFSDRGIIHLHWSGEVLQPWTWRLSVKRPARNAVAAAIPDMVFSEMFSPRSRRAFLETLRMAILASIAGTAVALPMALWSTRFGAPNRFFRMAVRLICNVIRSFPDLLWAALFVGAVGVGALPGLLALFFFTIAVITKLTADTLDSIDFGPVEAADAAGARQPQMLRTAVVPQILPSYTSYALYAFELNLRASVVLGLVGAGGIGRHIEYLRTAPLMTVPNKWERLWGVVFMFVIVVFVVDRLSAWLRRRLV